MSNEIEIVVKAIDKSAAGFGSTTAAAKKVAVDVEAANIRVEKATKALAETQEKYGAGSLQARLAVVELQKAQLGAAAAAEKLATAEKEAAASVDTVDKKSTGLKAKFNDVGAAAVGMLAGSAVIAGAEKFKSFMDESVEAASNLGESVNAVQQIFGASSAGILEWGKKNAESFGLSQQAFNELAGPLGAGLKNAGLSLQDTSKWTVDLTKRAADMASVFNTTVPEAMEAIQAGLRGESDPLEKFGVGLSAARVQALALSETGKTSASALTTQELATARLNLIMKQTSSTAGDFQRTSGGLANSQRITAAEWEDAKAKLGQGLLPAMQLGAKVSGEMASALGAMPAPLQAVTVATVALGAAAILLAPRIGEGVTKLRELGDGALAADTKLGGFTRSAGKVAVGLAALQAAAAAFGTNAASGVDTATQALREYAVTGQMSTDVTRNFGKDLMTLADSAWYDKAAKGFMVFEESATGLGATFDDSIQHSTERLHGLDVGLAQLVQSGNAQAAATSFGRITAEAAQQGISVDRLKQAFPGYTDALAGAGKQANSTAEATTKVAKSTADLRKEAEKATDALLGERGANRDLEQAIDDAAKSLKEHGRTLKITTQAGRDNQAALDAVAGAANKAGQAVLDAGGSQAAATAKIRDAQPQLEALAIKFGLTKKQARDYSLEVLAIPKTVTTTPKLDTAAAKTAIADLKARLAELNGVLSVPLNAGSAGAGLGVYKTKETGAYPIPRVAKGRVGVQGFVEGAAAPMTEDELKAKNAAAADDAAESDLKASIIATNVAVAKLAEIQAAKDNAAAILAERAANRDLEAALDSAAEALKKNHATLDIHTAKGRENQAALDGIASSAQAAANAVLAAGGSTAQAAAVLKKAEPQLEAMAKKFGMSKSAAHNYGLSVVAIPKTISTTVSLNLADAKQRLADLQQQLAQVRDDKVALAEAQRNSAAAVMDRIREKEEAQAALAAEKQAAADQAAQMAAWSSSVDALENDSAGTPGGKVINITVNGATANDPHAIGTEIAWAVKTAS